MEEVKTAVLLVGGAGLRMLPLTADKPKAMVEVCGKPVIYWVLNWLKNFGIKNVVVGVAYKKEAIIDYLQNHAHDFDDLKISEHTVEGETGEGFKRAIMGHVKDENFVAMNGDELTNINLKNMIESHLKNKPIATVAVSPLISPFGIVDTFEDNIIGFREKPILHDKLVSAGIYVFNKKILEFLPERGTIEKLTFPLLAERGLIKAYKLQPGERWATVNTLKDISRAEEELKLWGWLDVGGEKN